MKRIGFIAVACAVILLMAGCSKTDSSKTGAGNSVPTTVDMTDNSQNTATENKDTLTSDSTPDTEVTQDPAEIDVPRPTATPVPTATEAPAFALQTGEINESVAFASNLKLGWNLGNTFDATGSSGLSSETSWGQPKVTKELIDYIAECGFTSIRIPVSWGKHTDGNYTINSEWMARVTEVVDYALDAGLYVIINSHHDNDYYYPSEENMDNAKKYLTAIWTQIADNFADYDERLIFEAMNEPRLAGTDIEWWFQSTDKNGCAAIERISELDQVFVDTIRACGGNNPTRYLGVSSYAASPDFTMHRSFTIPDDPAGHLMISIHAYTPYDFTMNSAGYKEWDGKHRSDLGFIDNLYNNFVKKGYGVYIGEFGATNKNNLEDRVAWAKNYTSKASFYGIGCFIWDNGATGIGEENFGLINRKQLSIYFPDLLDAYLEAYQK